MSQQDDTEKVLGFLDGTLPREEREELLDRMREDPSLRHELESLQALSRSVASLPAEAPPPDFARKFMAAHAGAGLLERLRSFFQGLPAPALPALALAGAAACALLFLPTGDSSVPALPLAGCTLVAEAGDARVNGVSVRGDRTELRLEDRIRVDADFQGELHYPDGTRIKVKAGSELVVRDRGLYLKEGAVWLSVTKDLRGFKVETPLAMAAVKGTHFWVEVAGDVMKVAVTEGLVAVINDLGEKLLSAGKAALVGADRQIQVSLLEDTRHTMFRDAEAGDFGLER